MQEGVAPSTPNEEQARASVACERAHRALAGLPQVAAHSTKILVLYVPAGGGHKAAAQAIAEAAAARRVGCEVVDALKFAPRWFARGYAGAHLRITEYAPAFYGRGYAALNRRRVLVNGARGVFDRAACARLRRYVFRSMPDVVISTHFLPLKVLGRARRTGVLSAPLVGVVTDYAAHAFWAEPGVDRFCVPAAWAARDLVKHGVDPAAVVITGIPIRQAFGAIPPLAPPAEGEPLSVLVTSGGFGVGPILDVIRSFSGIPAVRLTVICGDNPRRVEQARRAAEQAGVLAEVVGFERDMPQRMAAAHVIVGKPGGLTVSESLAAGRPMVLVGACPGQETLNQCWMIEHSAAVAAEPALAGPVTAGLGQQEKIAALAQAARALSAPHAATRVLDVALRLAESAFEDGAGHEVSAAS